MEPFSLTVGVIGILTALKSCLKLVKKHANLELSEDDKERRDSLEYLQPVVTRSYEALMIVREYMDGGKTGKLFRGARFDKKLKTALKSLDDASKLFSMASYATQQAIMFGVNRYVQAVGEDIKEAKSIQLDARKNSLYWEVRSWLGVQADNNSNSGRHQGHLKDRHPGSGDWLASYGAFQGWLNTAEKGLPSRLWVRGPPGTGKSFLCSTAIDHLATDKKNVCLYYFNRFDDQQALGTSSGDGDKTDHGARAAALLVDQLFQQCWQKDDSVMDSVGDYIKTAASTMQSLAQLAGMLLQQSQSTQSPKTDRRRLFVFLDGLDESKDPRARGIGEVLSLVEGFGEGLPVVLKVWVSSRQTYSLNQRLQGWPAISVEGCTEEDVKSFLVNEVYKLQEDPDTDWGQEVEGQPLDEWILQKLQTRAQGNFLFARLMIEQVKEVAITVEDVVTFITSSLPTDLEQRYCQVFRQYRGTLHKYVSILFSLIAFARRPLHLQELQDAMMLALSDPEKRGALVPRAPNIKGLFPPLIETADDDKEPGNPLCRLCHSTVQEFLITNPEVLRVEDTRVVTPLFSNVISPQRIGDLCLRYLSQPRYSNLLEIPVGNKHEGWTVFSDDRHARQHAFLSYCTKYWNRHLEDLNPTPELRKALYGFLRSPNFQTLLQAQSLLVCGHFSGFRRLTATALSSHTMHRRVFPKWFGPNDGRITTPEFEESLRYRHEYRHFVNEWGYLLQRSSCLSDESTPCSAEHFWGEVDRCLTGLLGPTHFMGSMKERYPSFMLTRGPFGYYDAKETVIAEAVFAETSNFIIISSPSRDSADVRFDLWDICPPGSPRLISTSVNPNFKHKAAESVAFADEAACLIFGNRLLDQRGDDIPVRLDERAAKPHFEPLSTDFAKRGDVVVIGRRSVHKQAREREPKVTRTSKAQIKEPQDSDGDSSAEEIEKSDDDYSSTSSEDNSADETCSEGSTEPESDECVSELSSEEDFISDEEEEDSDGKPDELDDSEDGGETELKPDDYEVTTKPEPSVRREMLTLNVWTKSAEDKLDFEGEGLKKESERAAYPGLPGRFRDPKDRITATAAVYNIGSGMRLFHYEHDIPAMLYHSPPVLHPNVPLLVWPLGGGEVLFADYDRNTYFVRAIMPTTPETRHVSMKIRFSACGGYLHVASVEARLALGGPKTSGATFSRDENRAKPQKEIVLSLFVTTHRLSARKTTRSPPRIVHKVKLCLGQFAGLSLARLPFTFTWALKHLHFTVSSNKLRVFRVALFRAAPAEDGEAPAAPVTVPGLSVMLPLSAANREVHYLPPKPTLGSRGAVLLSSYDTRCRRVNLGHRNDTLRGIRDGMGDIANEGSLYAFPPAVLFVDEDRDLGGWRALENTGNGHDVTLVVQKHDRFRDGKLTRKMERFNWEEDVDLEGICDWCNSPIYYRRA